MRRPRWTGVHWHPLPSESIFSVLLRLKALNGLGPGQLLNSLKWNDSAPGAKDLYRVAARVNRANVKAILGWDWRPAEQDLSGHIGYLHDFLWAPRLRYCPICMQEGFHAVWFQLAALRLCPLHGCRIEECCMVCGAPMGPYLASHALFRHAYRCAICRSPFFGAPFLQEAYRDLRQHVEAVDRAFAPFHRWMQTAHDRLPFLNQAAARLSWRVRDIEMRAVMVAAIQQIVPYPDGCTMEAALPVLVHGWHTQQAHSQLRHAHPRREGYLTGRFAAQTYRTIVRRLQNEVLQTQACERGRFRLTFVVDRAEPIAQWTADALALILVRCAFEKSYVLDLATRLDSADLREDALLPALIGHTLQRGACRLVILGAYAMSALRAERYLRQGYINYSDFFVPPAESIVWSTCAIGPDLYGVMVMPATSCLEHILPHNRGDLDWSAIARVNEAIEKARAAGI